jgi:hypothetical protein
MASTINASTSSGLVNTADTSGILQLQTANTTALTVDGSQNIGIGTTSPSSYNSGYASQLVVKNGVTSGGDCGITLVTDSTHSPTLYFAKGTTGAQQYAGFVQYNNTNDALIFGANTNEKMRIDSSGNVGIGTTSPGAKLDVATSTAGALNSRIYNSATSGITYAQLQLQTDSGSFYIFKNNSTNTGSAGAGSINIYEAGAFPMAFYTNATERMRITSGGNLLIGTTSTLMDSEAVLVATNTGVTQNIRCAASSGGAGIHVQRSASTGNLLYFTYTTGATYVGQINTNGTSTSYSSASDYRLKDEITPMTAALETVAQLKPVKFKFKSDGSNGQGFIAHELQAVVPDAVVGEKDAVDVEGKPVYQGIDTSFLVATLTAALQETKALIDTQAETINALTARIVAIESKA